MDIFGRKRARFFQHVEKHVTDWSSLNDEQARDFVTHSQGLQKHWSDRRLHNPKLYDNLAQVALLHCCVNFMDTAIQADELATLVKRGDGPSFATARLFDDTSLSPLEITRTVRELASKLSEVGAVYLSPELANDPEEQHAVNEMFRKAISEFDAVCVVLEKGERVKIVELMHTTQLIFGS